MGYFDQKLIDLLTYLKKVIQDKEMARFAPLYEVDCTLSNLPSVFLDLCDLTKWLGDELYKSQCGNKGLKLIMSQGEISNRNLCESQLLEEIHDVKIATIDGQDVNKFTISSQTTHKNRGFFHLPRSQNATKFSTFRNIPQTVHERIFKRFNEQDLVCFYGGTSKWMSQAIATTLKKNNVVSINFKHGDKIPCTLLQSKDLANTITQIRFKVVESFYYAIPWVQRLSSLCKKLETLEFIGVGSNRLLPVFLPFDKIEDPLKNLFKECKKLCNLKFTNFSARPTMKNDITNLFRAINQLKTIDCGKNYKFLRSDILIEA